MRTASPGTALVITAALLFAAGSSAAPKRLDEIARLPRGSVIFTGGPGGLEGRFTPRVYAVDARGGKLREVLVNAQEPQWSPDGKKLAFLRAVPVEGYPVGGPPFDLYVMRLNGGGVKRITRLTRPDLVSDPNYTWSPDGKRIVYRDVVDRKEVISVIGANGRNKVRLGTGTTPIWSPDGSRIAFLDDDASLPNVPGADRSLFVVNPNGSRRRQITHGVSVFPMSPQSWSPDGKRIAFYPCCRTGFAIADVDSGRVRSYLDGRVAHPSWAPNGKWIAVTAGGTFLIRPGGTGLKKISSLGDGPFYPSWSPDSRALAIEDRCCSPDIWVLSLTGAPARRLTAGWRYGYGNDDPEWQPAALSTAKLVGRYVEASLPTDSVVEAAMLKTTRPAGKLVADGRAVAMQYARGCTEVWRPAERAVTRFPGNCVPMAFAGDRAAWTSGPSSGLGVDSWFVSTATLALPRTASVSGDWGYTRPLSEPVGDGSLIVFSSWGPCRISMNPPCAHEPKKNGAVHRLDGERAVRIASSPGPLTPLSVDEDRILVDHEDGTLELLRADGASLQTFRLNAAIVRSARLQGRDLVVLTTTSVEVTDTETGVFLRRWPTPVQGARLEDIQDGLAVLVAEREIHLLRLSDGRDAVIKVPGSGEVLAQLESSGLFYSYRVDDARYPGRVVFVPFSQLPSS